MEVRIVTNQPDLTNDLKVNQVTYTKYGEEIAVEIIDMTLANFTPGNQVFLVYQLDRHVQRCFMSLLVVNLDSMIFQTGLDMVSVTPYVVIDNKG